MSRIIIYFSFLTLLISCSARPKGVFNNTSTTPVDYSNTKNWSALPTKIDAADRTPSPELLDLQKDAKVDVFYLHPTNYLRKRGNTSWNASLNNAKVNKGTDELLVLNQASIFNGAGKVYAPRYRQAHIHSYLTKDKTSAKKAFDFAYRDVRSAFEYFLQQYNHGRPFIIASHSQGTNHAERLIKELIDGKPLQKQFVAAYLIGMPISKTAFQKALLHE